MSRPESELNRGDYLATLLVRQHAETIMADLPAEEAWVTAQRREDLAEDVRLWTRRRRQERIMRERARETLPPTPDRTTTTKTSGGCKSGADLR